ncbi:4652_t:CDS:2 [Paraglomus occultum]|uniref:4652_t:CDS:1 n=1 Tax=Paraglomus occultum TaxID=144539 RepID=A0A9N9G0X8_9GLOM|nr:4652_t:CDS:2 [Paraglomus occultum]
MSDDSQPATPTTPTTALTTNKITKILRDIYATGRASVTISFRPDFEITLGDKYGEENDVDKIEESEGSSIDNGKGDELKRVLEMLANECEHECGKGIDFVPVSPSNIPADDTKEHVTPSTCRDYTSPIKEDPLITNMPHCTNADLNAIEQTQEDSSQPKVHSATAYSTDNIISAFTDLNLSLTNTPPLAIVVEEQTAATHAEQIPETNVESERDTEETMITNTTATKHNESAPSQGLASACYTPGPQYQQPVIIITTEDNTATTDTDKESIEGTQIMVKPTDPTETSSIDSTSSLYLPKASSAQTLDAVALAVNRGSITENQMNENKTATPSDGSNTRNVKPMIKPHQEYIPNQEVQSSSNQTTILAEGSVPQIAQQQEQGSSSKSRRSSPRLSTTTPPPLSFLTSSQKSALALLLADTLQSRAVRPYFDLDCLADPGYVKLSLVHEFRRMRDRHRSRRQRLRSAFRFGGIAVYLRRYRELLSPSEQRQLLKTSWKELKVQRRFGMRVFELFEVFGEQAFGKVGGDSIDFLGDLTQGQYRELRFYVRGVGRGWFKAGGGGNNEENASE